MSERRAILRQSALRQPSDSEADSSGGSFVSSARSASCVIPAFGSRLRVLMAGPRLDVRGGVSSVERLVMEAMPQDVAITHVPTVVEGSMITKAWAFTRALSRFSRALKHRPDVVHLHFASRASSVRKEYLARMALSKGLKVVMHSHGAEYQMYWQEMGPRARARSLAVFQRISALIVLGHTWRDFFVSIGVPHERLAVMPNPVRLPAGVAPRATVGPVVCVYLGIISNRKGAFDLVDAVARMPLQSRQRLKLVMAGNGKVAELRRHVHDLELLDSIEVRDWLSTEQRDALLAAAHVFVLPSYHEGLPMALLEAMAHGVAPLSTPVGSIAEIVKHGENGLLVSPGDIHSLAAALVRLVESASERAAFGTRARCAVEHLSLDTYLRRLCELYRAVADGSALPEEANR